MYRFYCPALTPQTTKIAITDASEIHHIKNVLRFKKDSSIRVFNGQGIEGEGVIINLKPEIIELRCEKIVSHAPQTTTEIILACAIPKKSKFETIIEKATELGATTIIPLKTERTELALSSERAVKKHSRYESIVINAAKQSQRATLPAVAPITSFRDALKLVGPGTAAIIPCLTAENRKPLADVLKDHPNPQKIFIFIGPEGDFTPDEVTSALKAGCLPVTLGETVLKVETAALSVLAFIKFYMNS